MMLKPSTLARLNEICTLSWLSHCGKPFDAQYDVALASSWEEALRMALDPNTEDQRNEHANLISDQLPNTAVVAEKWNSIVLEVRPRIVDALSVSSAWAALPDHTLNLDSFRSLIRWDIIHFVVELEFSEQISTRRFTIKGDWYLRGRMPCGWLADRGSETLVVY